ncbi:MAG: cupin domain-containing protein, partial [Bdellovibrionales bacterium]|nr:cupin domain-containing protein [Bdellovibrionales bacterium]
MNDNHELWQRRENFHQKLRSQELLEGFSYDKDGFVTRPYWPLEPKNKMKPHLWKWSEIRPLVLECGEVVGLGRGSQKYDRRVLALSNPGGNGEYTLSGTLFGDIQLIKPGESAPSHRHTPCATRFILEGSGGWTTVGGDKVHVSPGDIVYTGQFPWHDHGNEGKDDFIFLDILDIPLLFFTGTSCWEFDFEKVTGDSQKSNQPAQVTDFPHHLYVNSQLRPAFPVKWERNSNDFAYLSWEEAQSSMKNLAEEEGCPYNGLSMELKSTQGDSVGRTVSVYTQWLRKGENTLSHRHTGAFIYLCTQGSGCVHIEEQTF